MKDYQRFNNVAVLGAGGKMGSGILLLSAIEMAFQSLEDNKTARNLYAVEVSENALNNMMSNIKNHIKRYAEKDLANIKNKYSKNNINISESEIQSDFENRVYNTIKPSLTLEAAYSASIIFEAVSENEDLKAKILSQIDQNNKNKPWFFTNTSSVPISVINEKAKLDGRVLGFHFYNPPAVQKLIEIISIKENPTEMVEFSEVLAKNMNKIVVHSNDVAGFIGNGFFMRDAIYGLQVVENLSKEMPTYEAIYCIDTITRDYLMRPMGIFQLMDYVGIDVVHFILNVMQKYIPNELLTNDLLNLFVNQNVKGGQNADGSQKNGFFKYENGKMTSIWDTKTEQYIDIEAFKGNCINWLGEMPLGIKTWKEILKSENRNETISEAFQKMISSNNKGSKYALAYAKNAQFIGNKLFKDNVAHNEEDVNTVMKTGFYHLYGPINNFI